MEETWHGEPVTRASLEKRPHEVAAMFDAVAERYDLANAVLSLGQDRRWRRAVVRAVNPRPGDRILDIAAGTGASSEPLAAPRPDRRSDSRSSRGDSRPSRGPDRGSSRGPDLQRDGSGTAATVVPCDFSLGMLRIGKRRRPDLPFVAADALRLPFADESFDVVTISFGLRNIADADAALREMLRVTRRGGRLVVCEFSRPTWPPFRTVYLEYLMRLVPAVARKVSSDPESYDYLAESIRAWPDQAALARRLAAAGWAGVAWRNLAGGVVALHRGRRVV